jgi:N-acyl-D-aspartate/D-glutamate deacylase
VRTIVIAETSTIPAPGLQRLFAMMDGLQKVWVLGDPPNYDPDPADSLAALAAALGRDPYDFALDVLTEQGGKQILFMPFANYADNNLDCCREMLLHPNTVPGFGDGGAHVGTICDASFTITPLTRWRRDRSRGELIDLPAGGARLEQKSVGFLSNVVSGQVTCERGQATVALPGRLVR